MEVWALDICLGPGMDVWVPGFEIWILDGGVGSGRAVWALNGGLGSGMHLWVLGWASGFWDGGLSPGWRSGPQWRSGSWMEVCLLDEVWSLDGGLGLHITFL